jgi:hypothetical protein
MSGNFVPYFGVNDTNIHRRSKGFSWGLKNYNMKLFTLIDFS